MIEAGRGKVLFVLPVLGQPRDSKRIAMLQETGFDVEAAAFDRPYHRGRMPDCPVDVLATIEHGNYLRRLLVLIGVVPKFRRLIRRVDVVYASGPDMGFAAILAGLGCGTPVVFEVGDIQRAQVAPGLMGRMVRTVDRMAARAAKMIVATAPDFVEQYYRRWLGVQTPAMVIENKLEKTDSAPPALRNTELAGLSLSDRPLRIGYFGLLRCGWSWNVLQNLAKSHAERIHIVVAGRPAIPPDLPDQMDELPNADFLGEYRSPSDLSRLYGSVDIVWACYPAPQPGEWNWKWARTNRFYESCWFGKPMIALRGSADAAQVAELDVGIVVDGGNQESAVGATLSITDADLSRWRANLRKLPRDRYEYSTEADLLASRLDQIVSSTKR